MNIKKFENRSELLNELSSFISSELDTSIKINGSASMLVSGGSTPKPLFLELAKKEIEWKNVSIGLVDERFVGEESEYSNAKLVKDTLIQDFASQANFYTMVLDETNYANNLVLVKQSYTKFLNDGADICILGMGNDGHTASLFPNDISSENDLKSQVEDYLNTNAPNEPKNRITCGTKTIKQSKHIILLLFGQEKLDVLKQAEENNYPTNYFLNEKKLLIYYAD